MGLLGAVNGGTGVWDIWMFTQGESAAWDLRYGIFGCVGIIFGLL